MQINKTIKTTLKFLGLLAVLLVFITVIFIVLKISTVDNSSIIPEEKPLEPKPYFNLSSHLAKLNVSNIKEEFPYKIYLDSANWSDIHSIHNDLELLQSIIPEPKQNQKILVKALTTELETKIAPRFKLYNPDSLIMLLQWVNKFQYYKDIDTNNIKFYRMVHRHWYNFVANRLGQYHDSCPDLNYNFKFKYLVSNCQAQDYPPDIRNSNTSKIIDNVVNNKWAYLFKRFWGGTGFLFKLLISVVIIFTFYSYYCVYKLLFQKKRA